MTKKMTGLILIFLLCLAYGCSSTLESVNKGAEVIGETGGKVMRIPNSVGEGAAEGIAGESESNPYGR